MRRSEAREFLMQLFYQMEAQHDDSKEFIDSVFAENVDLKDSQMDYMNKIIVCYLANKDEIDLMIENASVKWRLERMAKVDLAVLRLAVTEIKFLKDDDIPVQVSVNEAVNIAKKYGTEDSGRFVNGILGNLIHKQ